MLWLADVVLQDLYGKYTVKRTEVSISWDVTPCSQVDVYHVLESVCSSKMLVPVCKLHGVTSQENGDLHTHFHENLKSHSNLTHAFLMCLIYAAKSCVLTSYNSEDENHCTNFWYFSCQAVVYFCAVPHICYMLDITSECHLVFFLQCLQTEYLLLFFCFIACS